VLTTCRSLVLLHTLLSILTCSYFIPPNPNKVFAKLTIVFIGGLSLHVFLLACGSLRANRAVMLFAVNPVPTVASFQSLVPLSFHSATFSTTRKSSSFSSLNEPTQFYFAIRLLRLQLVFGGLIILSNTPTLITASNCSIPPIKSFRSVQSLPLPFPTLKQKITPALP